MSRWNIAWLLGFPGMILLGLTLSYSAPIREKDKNYQLVRMVVDVLAEVDQNFVKEMSEQDMQKLVESMINGGLEKIDPYSEYFNAEQYKSFETQSEGNFGGIGVQIGVDRTTGALVVISPIVGTPAWEAGMTAGDYVLKVNDQSTENMVLNDVVKQILGEPGTDVSVTILHPGAKGPETLKIKRAIIEIESVMGWKRNPLNPKEWDYFVDPENKIAYLRLVAFNEHSTRDMAEALKKIQAQGARGLILDLRDNPGGLLKSAIDISDLFLTDGRIVSTKNRYGKGRSWDAKEDGTLFQPAASHPMVVLVNRGSASASEILSAALQDNKRAIVIGERSFGKGSVQQVIKMPNTDPQTAIKLTTDTYWRPSGKNIHRMPDSKETDDWGVSPDTGFDIVMKDDERIEYFRDRRDRDIIQGKPNPMPKKDDKKPFVDRVMEKALEYLKKELPKVGAAPFMDFPVMKGA